jgi:hypothetical protein
MAAQLGNSVNSVADSMIRWISNMRVRASSWSMGSFLENAL